MTTDLVDYLKNNLLIVYYCSFNIPVLFSSYWTVDRSPNNFIYDAMPGIVWSQVLLLARKSTIDISLIGLDSISISDNTSKNNLNYLISKFKSNNHSKANEDSKLSVHTASNQTKKITSSTDRVQIPCPYGLHFWSLHL